MRLTSLGPASPGELGPSGATFKHGLQLSECYVGDGIDLSEATTRTLHMQGCYIGRIILYRTNINGDLTLNSSHLDGNDGPALYAEGLTVTASMFCQDGFRADGVIHLIGASIGGSLILRGAHLNGKGGTALEGQRLTVTADMLCHDGFQADGEINLLGASIGGYLSFRSAHLDGKDGPALTAEGLTVTADMFCDRGLQADGVIDLLGASIGHQLNLRDAHLNGKGGRALDAGQITVTTAMFCDEGFQADGEVSLSHAKLGGLVDERKSWPQLLKLDGLTYGDLSYLPARERLDWLNRSPDYSPQPYEQLAAYYRRLGHDDEARSVLLAKQRQRRRQSPWWKRWWGWLQDALAGYGYAPGRALVVLAGAFVLGWLVFSHRHPVAVTSGPHPTFNAALYTLDVLIPAPALGQASNFDPQGPTLWVAAGLHVLGWLLAITVIAAITRSFSKT